MVRPLGSLLLSLPVALVLAVPAAEAESSAATRNSSFDLFGLFQNDDASRGDVRQVQAQVQPSMGGSGQVQSEGLPPPGLAPQDMPASNGLPPAGGNANGPAPIGNQFGHQFGNQPAVQNDPNAIAVARPPAPLGSRSAAARRCATACASAAKAAPGPAPSVSPAWRSGRIGIRRRR